MSRSTIVNVLFILTMVILPVATGCASAATTPSAKPAATPANTLAATPAATPATPSAAPVKELSFKATTYTDTANGFTVQHPKEWKTQEGLAGYYVYNAKPISGLPNFYVSIFPTTSIDEISAISARIYQELGGSDFNYGKAEDLNWGSIKGKFIKLNWNFPGGYNLDTYSVTFANPGGDKSYSMSITAVADGINPGLCKEIFATFSFK